MSAKPWPQSLEWIVGQLRPTSLQRFKSFRNDAGPPSRRAVSSAREGLSGQIELTPQEWLELPKVEGLWTVPNAKTGREMTISLWEPPASLRETLQNGKPTSYVVQIALVVHIE